MQIHGTDLLAGGELTTGGGWCQGTRTGSVDILVDVGVPQAVEVISQAEQQGLADLRSQATARSAGGEFALDHRKDGFDLRALSIALLRNLPLHLSPHNSFGNPPPRLPL